MTKATDALNDHEVALLNVCLADGVEDGQACAEQGCCLGRVDIFGNGNSRLGAKKDVFSVATISAGSIVDGVAARLEETATA